MRVGARSHAEMSRTARVAAALLPHVNLLLTVVVGAGVATAARLKWDPSTYIVLRELMPLEYKVLAVSLLAGSLALLLLAHLASVALAVSSATLRRVLLLVYVVCMAGMLASEVATAWWVGGRVAEWLDSEQARDLRELAAARDDLRALLHVMSRWNPLPKKVHQLIEEASEDLPRNGYCAATLALLCILMQLLGVALAALAALLPLRARTRRGHAGTDADSQSSLLYSSKSSTLRTVYRHGRLQIV